MNQKINALEMVWPFLRRYRMRVCSVLFSLILTSLATLMIGYNIRLFIDGYSGIGDISVFQALVFLIFLGTILAIGTFSRYYNVSWLGERVSADIRSAVFSNVIRMNPGFFDRHKVSDIHDRVTKDTALLQQLIGTSISLALRNAILLVGGVLFLIYSHWLLALVVFGVAPLIVLPLIIFGKKVKLLSQKSQKKMQDLSSHLLENLQNVKTVQAFNRESVERTLFFEQNEASFLNAQRSVFFRALLVSSVIFLVILSVAVLLLLGSHWLDEGTISPGQLFSVIFYAVLAASSTGAITEVFADLQKAVAAVERLRDLTHCTSELPVCQETVYPKIEDSGVVLKGVDFCYQENLSVLQSISLDFPEKGVQIVVGKSGSGKSTLLDLLMRFYEVDRGDIYFFGQHIKTYPLEDLRKMIGYVNQFPRLFSGTVFENVCYASPNLSREMMQEILQPYLPDTYWEDFAHGLDTLIQENGVGLSGGQIQRIAIARALITQPKILLLDEITSALDPSSEAMIVQLVQKLSKDHLLIMVTHQMSIASIADRIIVFNEGMLEEKGTHKDLLLSSQIYASFVEASF